MNKIKLVLVVAGLSLAVALTFSCSAYLEEIEVGACGNKYYRTGYNDRNGYDSNLLCQNDVIVVGARCYDGSRDILYNPKTQFCQSSQYSSYNTNTVKERCGGLEYSQNQRCGTGNVVESQCDGAWISSKTHYCKNGTEATMYGSFEYGGQAYKTVQIYGQTWMAENLNYNANGSKCYGNNQENCSKYGRLYDWVTAMALNSDCNSDYCELYEPHRGICPTGWHIPSRQEFHELASLVSNNAIYLKATGGWDKSMYVENQNGQDVYGFAALPGGNGFPGGNNFSNVSLKANWWVKDQNYETTAYYYYTESNSVSYHYESKRNMFSVRCIKD